MLSHDCQIRVWYKHTDQMAICHHSNYICYYEAARSEFLRALGMSFAEVERRAAVMVDEYQDTNALQDALYRCLASPAGDDLFLVGDLKQSIYRFRQADPSIFREKLDAWPLLPGGAARPRPTEGTPGQNALLALDANFRSAPEVVRGINFLFEQLMTPALGDTAYGDGHTVRRYFEYKGYDVNYVSNFTDVDDKIIKKAIEEQVSAQEISQRYIAECKKDMAGMNVKPATKHPLATEEICGMVEMISELIEKGYAYEKNGTVYFSTRKFKDYGKLSHKNLDDLRSGGRSLLVSGEDEKDEG